MTDDPNQVDKLFLQTDDHLMSSLPHALPSTSSHPSTSNQLPSPLSLSGFEQLEPPLNETDYMFGLTEGEGIADLFDSFCDKDFLKMSCEL